jgi:hypothetical protein
VLDENGRRGRPKRNEDDKSRIFANTIEDYIKRRGASCCIRIMENAKMLFRATTFIKCNFVLLPKALALGLLRTQKGPFSGPPQSLNATLWY